MYDCICKAQAHVGLIIWSYSFGEISLWKSMGATNEKHPHFGTRRSDHDVY